MTQHITFDEAREILGGQTAIRNDGLHYVRRPLEDPDIIELSLVTDENSMRVGFHRDDNFTVQADGNTLRMREHHGEDAELELFRPWICGAPTVYCTAETAAAFMDALHSDVCRQEEGSDSAYDELYEVADKLGGGFPMIWSWAATMAVAARARMEALWTSGEAEFVDCVHLAAQEFHNYITDPRTQADALTPEKAVELWETAHALQRASEGGSPRAADA